VIRRLSRHPSRPAASVTAFEKLTTKVLRQLLGATEQGSSFPLSQRDTSYSRKYPQVEALDVSSPWHGSQLAVGMGPVRGEVLVGDLRHVVSRVAADLSTFVIRHRRFRKVQSYGEAAVFTVVAVLVRTYMLVLPGLKGWRPVEQWAAGHAVDPRTVLGATYAWARRSFTRGLGSEVIWTALFMVAAGVIAGATGSRLVQYALLGVATGVAPH